MTIPDRPTVSVPEAARLLGISKTHAYALAERGDLPTIRLGRRVLVVTRELRRLLDLDEADHG